MAIVNDGTTNPGADGSWFQTYYQNANNPAPTIPFGNGANILNPVAQAAQIAALKTYNQKQAAVEAQLAKIRAAEQANLRAKLAEQQRLLNERNLQRLNDLNNNQAFNPWDPSISLGGQRGGTSDWFSEYMGNASVAGKPYATGVNITHADELLLGKGNVLKENRDTYLSKLDPKKAKAKAAEFKRADNVDAMLESALADPTIDDATKAQYQKIRDTIVFKGDTEPLEIQLHNAATISAYRRAIGNWQNKSTQSLLLPGMTGPTTGTSVGGFYGDPGFDVDNLQDSDLEKAPNIVLERDSTGRLYIRKTDQAALAMFGTLKKNPAYAAQMIIKLAAWGAYGGGAEKYAAQRIKFDSKGRPVAGTWNVDDQRALDTFIKETSRLQAAGETTPWNELLDQVSTTNSTIASSAGYGAAAGGGGGGGYGYGGGGANTGISYTPPDLLKQTINGIARSRLGQVLSDADVSQFVADFHAKEAAFVNARVAGLDGTQVDPESAAAAWIESHFRDQQAAMAGNNLISDLAKFLMGGGMSGQ